MKTGFLYDPRFLEHEPGAGHPERKERLSTSIAYLRQTPWFETDDPADDPASIPAIGEDSGAKKSTIPKPRQ